MMVVRQQILFGNYDSVRINTDEIQTLEQYSNYCTKLDKKLIVTRKMIVHIIHCR
jgi:hypothetical protein